MHPTHRSAPCCLVYICRPNHPLPAVDVLRYRWQQQEQGTDGAPAVQPVALLQGHSHPVVALLSGLTGVGSAAAKSSGLQFLPSHFRQQCMQWQCLLSCIAKNQGFSYMFGGCIQLSPVCCCPLCPPHYPSQLPTPAAAPVAVQAAPTCCHLMLRVGWVCGTAAAGCVWT